MRRWPGSRLSLPGTCPVICGVNGPKIRIFKKTPVPLFLNGSTNNCLMFWVVSTDNKHALSLQNHFVLGWWFWSHSKYTHTFHIKKNCFIWCWTVKFINGSFSGTIPVKLMKTTWDKWFALKVLFCTKVIWIYSCSQHDWRVCGH